MNEIIRYICIMYMYETSDIYGHNIKFKIKIYVLHIFERFIYYFYFLKRIWFRNRDGGLDDLISCEKISACSHYNIYIIREFLLTDIWNRFFSAIKHSKTEKTFKYWVHPLYLSYQKSNILNVQTILEMLVDSFEQIRQLLHAEYATKCHVKFYINP